ncbi:glycoside hydrolase family 2 protein [Acetanaerobacterium elongatum]|uniref:Glycosyl hydrolases family 2 n=1 Tax=Acetanaerobacterium elongatum TaxID=258515 RepID=A0A1H0F184_9FIRM|nr:sugar-binding domain-containing protein [Acetanaerobacterium elongatum]SDN88428.1 Glycosyl hydrolases family 2 [Acetanaerobacterium elongatum]
MKTKWGEALGKDHILQEYPRPQLRRDSYINLNGGWEYAITETEEAPNTFDGEILVPFSPESELSGVNRALLPSQTLWYRRIVRLPDGFNQGRVLLHFGAVDQIATVYINGTEVCSHIGGYTPFSADITAYLKEQNTLLVKVRDYSDTCSLSRGKQKSKRGGIWYTAQSGIWQTVWIESVPEHYIESLRITPLFDESAVELTVISTQKLPCTAQIGDITAAFTANEPVRIPLPSFIPWTPENPHLYDLTVTMGDDRVASYFGMRKFSVGSDNNGVRRLFLNNEPYFHNGLLDQGYYSDGMYTPPSDEAMIFDIQTAKNMGFNMLRKHIKIEPLRWYYHCDRLGMLVWQDMVSGGGQYNLFTISSPLITGIHFKDNRYKSFARDDVQGREQYYQELDEMLRHLYNTVSVAMWVPFNEGWGQFDAAKAVERILATDTTRTIDHASGWHDQHIGELKSLHVYYKRYRFKPDKLGRAVVLSEFGGYNFRVPGHSFNEKDFGYKRYETAEDLLKAYEKLYNEEILPAKKQGLCATVYTQLTDVEDELNGLITYDRKIVKLPIEAIRTINKRLTER